MPSDAKKKKKFKPTILEDRRTPIDIEKKKEMLAVLIRNQEAFETVQEVFTVKKCLDGVSEPLSLVWKLVKRFYRKYGELPFKTQIESDLHNEIGGNPSLLTTEEGEEVDEFLAFAYDDKEHGKNIAKSKSHARVATETCRAVLEESVAAEVRDRMHKEGTLPVDLPALLTESQNALNIVQTLVDIDLDVPFPEGWDKRTENELFTTGNESLDAFMGGGWRAGECVLFMAPYGSCKTTLACHATANLIHVCKEMTAEGQVRKNKAGEPLTPVVVLVFTESDKEEYRNRLIANLAKVPWKKLAAMHEIADLDKSKKPGLKDSTKYELKEFKEQLKSDKQSDGWEHEQRRVKVATKMANKHLFLIDCTDADDNPYQIGSGGMVAVSNVVRGVFRRKKDCYPLAIWVDHLSGLVDRMVDDYDETETRRILTKMPLVAIEQLGKRLHCPVGLMHQFSGATQNKGTVAKYHHSDGEGSKSIGKYANFCVVCGKVDDALMCNWECTKHRREPPKATRIVHVDGDFSRLIDCTDTHGIEPGRNVIMSKEEMKSSPAAFQKSKDGINALLEI